MDVMILAALCLIAIQNEPIAKIVHPALDETSGIIKSRNYKGIYWVHNDSGDSARIFPITLDGSVVMPPYETGYWANSPHEKKKEWKGIAIDNASNNDWEDIAIDGDILYIADTGNNGNARRDLGVYMVKEPNPAATGRVRALKFFPVAYPDQDSYPPKNWHFDCESIFVHNHKLYFVSKHRAAGKVGIPEPSANLYVLDTQFTDRTNKLRKIDGASGLGGWITAADASPDGKKFAILAHSPLPSIWIYDIAPGKEPSLKAKSRQIKLSQVGQAEALCFDNNSTIIITNEEGQIFKVSL